MNFLNFQAEIPEVFEPFKNVYVSYWISGLDWNPERIVFKARASVSTSVGHDRNVTFVPDKASPSHDDPTSELIPMDRWNMTSPDDFNSHLLQGVRLSTEFFNSIMWYATKTEITKYKGGTKVLDSIINGTVRCGHNRNFEFTRSIIFHSLYP